MLDPPFETTLVIVVFAASLVAALLTLLVLVLNRFRRTFRKVRGKLIKHISISENTFRFVFTILWISVSAAVLFLAAFIQSYDRFTHKELVAEVHCMALEEGDGTASMYLELTPFSDGERQKTLKFLLNGDQWALEGDILKWDDFMNFLGIHTMYKLTRIRGRYINYQDEISRKPSVYSLIEKEERPEWRWLYKYGHKLRFVDAVYGNTVFTYPSETNVYEVYVTTSGFIVDVGFR
ncbi:hypothetical protein GWO43_30080, partial [candidate division KSB1 bacterium]|nr:hypothetical protein [candidate division KSB1 bacterium]NIR68805.1 hypothetical protein [candidate division KSB1 bacterium]NIS28137.1 hypothetical protein [candidate division KSB1 bacterium]NIT75033.1 hypothetical protein [candidate division KSB1 bacterium]NIU28817.1 hypothetical protein [candidate division KSB1 bacterium]